MAAVQATAQHPTPRSGAIDALRVISVAAIIVSHTWSSPLVQGGLFTWHVPVFFILSGYLWTAGRPLRRELGARYRTLILPYLSWLVILYAPYAALPVAMQLFTVDDALRPIIAGSANGGMFGAFWFMTALFFAAIFLRILERMPSWVRLLLVATALTAAYLSGQVLGSLPLSVGAAAPAVVFLLAGVWLRKLRPLVRHPLTVGLGLLAVAFLPVLIGISAPLDMKQADFGTPVLSVVVAIAISFGLLLVLESLFSRLGRGPNAAATMLASGAIMVVLTHPFVLWALRIPVPERQWWILFPVMVLPWFAALMLRKTALAPYLLGVARKPTEPVTA